MHLRITFNVYKSLEMHTILITVAEKKEIYMDIFITYHNYTVIFHGFMENCSHLPATYIYRT